MFKDYYAILDVQPCASGEAIRRAFRRLALQFHPDKRGGGGGGAGVATTAELIEVAAPDVPPLVSAAVQHQTVTASLAMSGAPTDAVQLPAKDFTDIQEAYEVLGDVARRYLYDMNYQELLAVQHQRQQEELQRRDAHARAVAEAVRTARERERLRQQQYQQQQVQLSAATDVHHSAVDEGPRGGVRGPSPPLHTVPPGEGRGPTDGAATSSTLPSTPPPAVETVLSDVPSRQPPGPSERVVRWDECVLEELDGDTGRRGPSWSTRYSSTAPVRLHRGGRGVGELEAQRTQRADREMRERRTVGQAQTRVSRADTTPACRTVPSTFVLSSSVSFSWGATAEETCASVKAGRPPRRQWHRRRTTRQAEEGEEEEVELPIEHYYQRSVQRTLQVFFGLPHLQ
ncbi:chaperone protein DNAj [Novymonas esmeraldas]|uniref:Chaperone protein DNAj n=1 Tax=Novymonas esmeraldas TaxID=1808958 RepID=A0AAW0F3T3_9TRYP